MLRFPSQCDGSLDEGFAQFSPDSCAAPPRSLPRTHVATSADNLGIGELALSPVLSQSPPPPSSPFSLVFVFLSLSELPNVSLPAWIFF